jgi:hypothetical protein
LFQTLFVLWTCIVVFAVAAAADTALALESSNGLTTDPITVLITATNEFRTTLSPCIDTLVTLCQQQIPPRNENVAWTIQHCGDQENADRSGTSDDTLVVHRLWNAEIHSSPYTSPEIMEEQTSMLEYAVVERDMEFEIRWRGGNTAVLK